MAAASAVFFCLFSLAVGIAGLWRAAIDFPKRLHSFHVVLHEACEVGLEMDLREADVLLERGPQLGGPHDQEYVTNCSLGSIFRHPLESFRP